MTLMYLGRSETAYAAAPPMPTVTNTIEIGRETDFDFLSITPDGKHALAGKYAAASSDDKHDALVVDISNGAVEGRINDVSYQGFTRSTNSGVIYRNSNGAVSLYTFVDGTSKELAGTKGFYPLSVSDDTSRMLLWDPSSSDASTLVTYDIKRQRRLATVYRGKELNRNGCLSPDGKTVYVLTSTEDAYSLSIVNAENARVESTTRLFYTSDSVLSDNSFEVYTASDGSAVGVSYTDNSDGSDVACVRYDIESKNTVTYRLSTSDTGVTVGGIGVTPDFTKLVGLRVAGNASGDSNLSNYMLYTKDLSTGKEISSVQPTAATVLSVSERRALVSGDGSTLYAFTAKELADLNYSDGLQDQYSRLSEGSFSAIVATDLKSGETVQTPITDGGEFVYGAGAKNASVIALLVQSEGAHGGYRIIVLDTHGTGRDSSVVATVRLHLPLILGGIATVVIIVLVILLFLDRRHASAPSVDGVPNSVSGMAPVAGAASNLNATKVMTAAAPTSGTMTPAPTSSTSFVPAPMSAESDGEASHFCDYCGAPIRPGARFCPSCGKSLKI